MPLHVLKVIVISMGFLIIGGFLWVGVEIFQRVAQPRKSATPAAICSEAIFKPLPGFTLRHAKMRRDGGWALHYQSANQSEQRWVVTDACGTPTYRASYSDTAPLKHTQSSR